MWANCWCWSRWQSPTAIVEIFSWNHSLSQRQFWKRRQPPRNADSSPYRGRCAGFSGHIGSTDFLDHCGSRQLKFVSSYLRHSYRNTVEDWPMLCLDRIVACNADCLVVFSCFSHRSKVLENRIRERDGIKPNYGNENLLTDSFAFLPVQRVNAQVVIFHRLYGARCKFRWLQYGRVNMGDWK